MVRGGVLADEQRRCRSRGCSGRSATSAEDLHLARRQPVRQRRARAGRAERRDPARSSAGMPIRSASRVASPSSAAAARGRRRRARAACGRTRRRVWASQVAAPMRRLSSIARSKWRSARSQLAERRGEHAEVAVGGAVAGDDVADHRRSRPRAARARGRAARPSPRRRAPRTRRSGTSARRATATRGTRRAPRRRPARARARASVSMPELGEQRREPRPPGPPAPLAGQQPDHGRELGQPALLAADAEHLDPVARPRRRGRSAAGSTRASAAPSPRRPPAGPRTARSPSRSARRRGGWNGCAVRSAVARTAATSRARRSMSHSATNAATRQLIASVRSSTSPSSSAMSRASVSIASTSLGRASSRAPSSCATSTRGERGAVAEPRGPSRPPPARTAAPRACSPRISERAGEAAEHADAQLRGLVAERGGGALEQLDRDLVGDHRAPARVLVADRGAREQLGVADSRAISAACANAAQRVDAPGRRGGRTIPELEQQLGALGRARRPRARARRAAAPPASSNAERRRSRPARRARCTRRRARSPPSGAAAAKWCARSARPAARRRRARAPRRPAGAAPRGAAPVSPS